MDELAYKIKALTKVGIGIQKEWINISILKFLKDKLNTVVP